jgi:hypothetical protein
MLSGLSGLDFGLSFASGFSMQASLRAKSEEAARQLGMAVQGLMAMAAMNSQQNPEAVETLKKVQVAQAGPAVEISLRLTEAEMAESLAQLEKAGARSGVAAAQPAARPPEPRRTQPGRIRIVGADTGAVEIPVNPVQ